MLLAPNCGPARGFREHWYRRLRRLICWSSRPESASRASRFRLAARRAKHTQGRRAPTAVRGDLACDERVQVKHPGHSSALSIACLPGKWRNHLAQSPRGVGRSKYYEARREVAGPRDGAHRTYFPARFLASPATSCWTRGVDGGRVRLSGGHRSPPMKHEGRAR